MTWTARSLLAFAVGVFAATLTAQGLYHLIGTPGCESTVVEPVRCSQESGWWALVLGGGAIVGLGAARRAGHGVVARLVLAALLLGGGTGALGAVVDDRTDAGAWVAAGAVAGLLGIALLAGVAAAALRGARASATTARVPETLGKVPETLAEPPAARTAPPPAAAGGPAIRVEGGQDPFGRDPGEATDPFGREE